MPEPLKSIDRYKVFQSLLGLIIFEGVLAIFFYFRIPSEARNVFWGGYSFQRLAIGILLLTILLVFIVLFIIFIRFKKSLAPMGLKAANTLASYPYRIIFLIPLWIVVATGVLNISFYLFPVLSQLMPFMVINKSVIGLTGMAQLWVVLISLKFLIFYALFGQGKPEQENLSLPFKLMFVTWVLTGTILLLSILWGISIGNTLPQVMMGPAGKFFVLSVWFSIWLVIYKKNESWVARNNNLFSGITIWLLTFLISCQVAQWMNSLNTPADNYWNLLADAFLNGRLFLVNPGVKHDLTFYNGHWYVPIPPLPAFLMLPFIAFWGVKAFNTTFFSLALASTTSVLIFLILEQLKRSGWIKLSRFAMGWLVALMTFGTVHLWLSILSKNVFLSQVCAELFIAFSVLLALKRYPAWVSGLSLAIAILARPNVFTLWPVLVGISIQLQLETDGKFSLKRFFASTVGSAIPILLAVCFLLYYNFIRFGNFFDFGYVTINGASWVVANAQKYGVFNLHFLPDNIQSMFFALPYLASKCGYYLPRGSGISLFATTPAFFYLFRKFKISWWTIGCWLSILLSIILLAMYHNNGAVQYGYRYVLDFAIPMVMLISLNAGQRISLPLKILIVISILINYYGIVSWFHGPC